MLRGGAHRVGVAARHELLVRELANRLEHHVPRFSGYRWILPDEALVDGEAIPARTSMPWSSGELTTASAPLRLNPPTNTASRRKSVCSDRVRRS